MTPQQVTLQLVGSRTIGKLVGCGCLATAALAALPIVLIATLAAATLPGGAGAGVGQTGILGVPATGFVLPSGEPLQPGAFRVTQGFGCTDVGREPPPPVPYRCPPDAAHLRAVRFHTGIDLAAPSGAVVYAVTAGSVQLIRSATGFGQHLVLTPSPGASATAGLTYLYGHLSAPAVPDGAAVRAGEPIGFVGTTGNSTGPHLHFEVDLRGLPINPCPNFPLAYLPAAATSADCLGSAL